jgi:predicted short-subunit dehydrogenase-like oxidoreductase (DUF2520 family)
VTGRPGSAAAPYGIVGSGRLARHLGHYLSDRGQAVHNWSRRTADAPEDGAAPDIAVEEALAACPIVLVLIKDDAIEPFLASVDLTGKTLIHASGSLRTNLATSMHPLYTFGPGLYPQDVYPRIPFVCDEDGPEFPAVFPHLENPNWRIASRDRPRYHAACVMGGNFTTLLWAHAMEIFRDVGLPPEAALPYLERTCANVAEHGGEALTGPLVRGDRRTILENLAALQGDPWAAVYQAFVQAARPDLLPEADPVPKPKEMP